jgi:hypothetical protein
MLWEVALAGGETEERIGVSRRSKVLPLIERRIRILQGMPGCHGLGLLI